MKILVQIFCVTLALAISGCSSKQPAKAQVAVKPAATAPAPIITPDYSLSAKVVSVNTVGRFVVLSFPAGGMPKIDQTLFLYRGGLKVAELRVTGPQQENNIVADLTTGDAQVGDTVSDK
jgi:hypothetical protein